MPRLAVPLLLLALAAALASGCGSSRDQSSTRGESAHHPAAPIGAAAKRCESRAVDAAGLRVAGVSCAAGRRVMLAWRRAESCAPPAGASRSGCEAVSFRCAGVRAGRGLAVSCSRPGRSVAFLARRR